MTNHFAQLLLDARTAEGIWVGELSSSALSTATATFALQLYLQATPQLGYEQRQSLQKVIDSGHAWLLDTQNPDGGWGDTTLSLSNLSTTTLCWAALAKSTANTTVALQAAETWMTRRAGSLAPKTLAAAIRATYGKDQTFSVPILTMCALAGRLGDDQTAWRLIPQLPFELAACPHQWFKLLRLPVVSYALPALIAIGQVRHARRPTRNPIARLLRRLTKRRTLRVLQSIQPQGGGFLEAIPLTSFVVMSLIGAENSSHPVVDHGIEFLTRSARPDGSWPIDTNLSTWITTLAVNALARSPDFPQLLPDPDKRRIRDWLLAQQYKTEHPYTHAPPGAWAWTNLPGGVPDADDTAGALIALHHLTSPSDQSSNVVVPHPECMQTDAARPNQSRDRKGAEESSSVASLQAQIASESRHGHLDSPNLGNTSRDRKRAEESNSVSSLKAQIASERRHRNLDAHNAANTSRDREGAEEPNDAAFSTAPPAAAVLNTPLNQDPQIIVAAAEGGIIWLLNIQNRDGGIPTFCRGWGTLPFDRSGADLTAHAILAWSLWRPLVSQPLASRITNALHRAVTYLAKVQLPDGSWIPLWFGNQHHPDYLNPTYGTSRVLCALIVLDATSFPAASRLVTAGSRFLLQSQNSDGAWGGHATTTGSIEETALALIALQDTLPFSSAPEHHRTGIEKATQWLERFAQQPGDLPPSPIGFYFANLWYFEKLYPLLFAAGGSATPAAGEPYPRSQAARTHSSTPSPRT